MASRKPPRRLFKGADRVSSYHHDRSPGRRMKEMTRDRADVLQNIEFALVKGHNEDPRVDDRDAREALRAHAAGKEPAGERAAALVGLLESVRELRADVPDDVWRDALAVVDESVGRHSGFLPGETSYLRFAGKYVQ